MAIKAMTLTDFLLARIAEDEAAATERTFTLDSGEHVPFGEIHVSAGRIYADPHHRVDVTDSYSAWVESLPLSAHARRALRECEAKRRIVELAEDHGDLDSAEPDNGPGTIWMTGPWRDVLEALAMPYSDHPDYRQEWRV